LFMYSPQIQVQDGKLASQPVPEIYWLYSPAFGTLIPRLAKSHGHSRLKGGPSSSSCGFSSSTGKLPDFLFALSTSTATIGGLAGVGFRAAVGLSQASTSASIKAQEQNNSRFIFGAEAVVYLQARMYFNPRQQPSYTTCPTPNSTVNTSVLRAICFSSGSICSDSCRCHTCTALKRKSGAASAYSHCQGEW
jgi:hypothetical protein